MSKETAPLKYGCIDNLQEIVKNCQDNNAAKLIMELYDLIVYQKDMIKQQRIEIIGLQHKQAWKRYDLPDSKFIPSVDKPAKSGNMSC
ncbi:hypothetical protein EB001_22320 [bacterium]|nr:hypothetical protein [bacterium]